MSTPLLRVAASKRKWRTADGEIPILSVTNGRSTVYVGTDEDLDCLTRALVEVLAARDAMAAETEVRA